MFSTNRSASAHSSKVTPRLRWPLVYVAALACAGCGIAAQRPDLGDGFGRKVAGSYLLDVRHDGFPPALALVTLTRDGGFLSTDVSDQGAGGLSTIDSPLHGTWKGLDQRTLGATTIYFGFDTKGIPQWIARNKGTFVFDREFKSGKGTLRVERFRFHQDPLDPNEIPADVLNATFTARRITAD